MRSVPFLPGRASRLVLGLVVAVAAIWCPLRVSAQAAFINWENPPVHPLDLSPDGNTLAVANLADDRIEFYDLSLGVPVASGVVQVGLDPTAVRFRTDGELWATNVISDSVSVIDVASKKLIATIATLDQPMDVVFAGSPERAYVSCFGVSTVQVFDTTTRAQTAAVAIDTTDIRSLAVSADKTKVYATVYHSGNGSTLLGGGIDDSDTLSFPPNVVSDPVGPYGGVNPPPNAGTGFEPPFTAGLPAAPKVALIVKKDAEGRWMDDNNHDWTNLVSGPMASRSGRPVGWDLPDRDLVIIDASNNNAVSYATRLMNMCMAVSVNPATGLVYVVGTDGINEMRFEPNVNGIFVRVQVGIVNPAGPSTTGVLDLNSHLDYSVRSVSQAQRDLALGDPRGIAWNADGTRGYVTGMGSNNIIVIDGSGARVAASPLNVGQGPTGVVVDDARSQVYVQNRFDGTISVVSTATLTEKARVSYFDPTPSAIRVGRKHLYDTRKNSGLGQASCASCHIDGKMDKLAWDLGDPSGTLKSTSGQNNLGGLGQLVNGGALDSNWHPMKGPMTTQTLQDIIGKEPLHWRGDRFGIEEFNGAFIGLQADDVNLTVPEMAEFKAMLASIYFPPNRFRNFENTLPTAVTFTDQFATGRFALPPGAPLPVGNAANGLNIYRNNILDAGALDCVTCHTLPVGAGANINAQIGIGFPNINVTFNQIAPGSNGEKHLFLVAIDGSTQDAIKVPQLRNMAEKVGLEFTPGHLNNRVGFGFTHDGAVDSLARFVSEPIFRPTSDQQVADLVAFMLAFSGSDLPLGSGSGTFNIGSQARELEPLGELSNDTHAATGRQVTINSNASNSLINQMFIEANENGSSTARGVDIVVKGRLSGVDRGWFYDRTSGNFISDRDSDGALTPTALRNLASVGSEQTYTVVPRASGRRIGVDRDSDGFGDRTEIEACTDPANPNSRPDLGVPELSVSVASLDFGSRELSDGTSGPQVASISNVGTANLFFTGAKLVIVGPDASSFAISNSPSTALVTPLGNRTVNVTFTPVTVGAKAATLLVITDDCDEAVTQIALTGIGTDGPPTPTVEPTDPPTFTPTPSPTATEPPPTPTETIPPHPTETEIPPTPTATELPPTQTPTMTPTPGSSGRAVGDFNDSGCTDLEDFLFLLDNWQTISPIGPPMIDLNDFLALLDNWQAGAGC